MKASSENHQTETEKEISRWNGFAKVLRTEDKQAFDEAMNTYRELASENNDAAEPAVFEQMMLSITTGQMAKLNKIKDRLSQIEPPKPKRPTEEEEPKPAEPTISYIKPAPKKAQRGLSDFS